MPHKIYSVTVDSVRGCELAQVVPTGPVTVIGGKNAMGKSSFLDAIAMTLGGKKLFPKNPIFDEREEAHATVRLEGESDPLPWPCTVTRTLSRDEDGEITTRVRIEADDGSLAPSPQTILNDVLGKGLSFDPLAFVREKPAKQVDIVKGLVGLDFTELDEEHEKVRADRLHAGRVEKQLDGKLKQTPIHNDVPSEPVDINALVEQLKDADAHNNQIHMDQQRLRECVTKVEHMDANAKTAGDNHEQKLEAIAKQYHEAVLQANEAHTQQLEAFKIETERLTAEIKALEEMEVDPIDTTVIQDKIARAGETNEKLKENAARLELYAEKRQFATKVKGYTKRLREIEAEKGRQCDEAEWPIVGMGFGQDGLELNGTPFQDLSSKEQMNCSVAIAMKLNPVFPFCMIRDGSLLDSDAMIELEAIVANHDGQVFIERVTEDEESCHIVFEAGKAKK